MYLLSDTSWANVTCSQITLLISYFKKTIILLTTKLLLKHELLLTANNRESIVVCLSTSPQAQRSSVTPTMARLTSLGATRQLVVRRLYCYCSQAAWACEPVSLSSGQRKGEVTDKSFLHMRIAAQICHGRSVAKLTCKKTANRELLLEL